MIKPTFTIYNGDDLLTEAILDGPTITIQKPLPETALISFELSPKEAETQYCIHIGDLRPEKSRPTNFRRGVCWEETKYLDSARGIVTITLSSRIHEESSWIHRVKFDTIVIPSKLSEEKFQVMFNDLVRLSNGLVFDLISLGKVAHTNRVIIYLKDLFLFALHKWN